MLGGQRMSALTSREMREIDRLAVEETGPALLQMMENAGRSMAVLTLRKLRDVYPAARVVVLAGPGGNGGGGICAARHLAWRLDEVEVCLSAPLERLSEATRVQLDLFLATGRTVVSAADLTRSEPPDLIVDALIGYGLREAPRGEAASLIEWANGSGAIIVSLDLPSGLDADTGDTPGAHVRPSATLTLHMPKPGLVNPVAGRLYVADLGIPAGVTGRIGVEPPLYGPAFVVPIAREPEGAEVAEELEIPECREGS
jgi:NAD(P)H-hydrate epimerase